MPRPKKDADFLRLKFQEYYINNPESIQSPDRTHMREFAIEGWDTGDLPTYWTRHIGFRSSSALTGEVIRIAPPSIYHSAAFYNYPVARNMFEKKWQGAELVFDIDADHLDAPCANHHDAWRCNNPDCGKAGVGLPPEAEGCPSCGGTSFSTRKWICNKCLELAKTNTIRIYDDFLVGDFGIDSQNIELNYSGHRGYHIRVKDPRVFKLNSGARTEIAHHITGLGFTSDKFVVQRGQATVIPARDAPGWAGKTADAMVEFIRGIDQYDGSERWVSFLREAKVAAIEGLLKSPPLLSSRVKNIGVKSWQEIASRAAFNHGGEIDIPVTHDIHRVIRLIGSLNGKTGFTVTPLTRDEIDNFTPFRDALAFSDSTLKIVIEGGTVTIPEFIIGDDAFGPFGREIVDLPIAAAVFLVCKGVAKLE